MRVAGRMGWSVGAALLAATTATAASASGTAPKTCTRTDFEAVVDGAAETLRTLTQKNSPSFQAKLRQLKDKRGWSHDQFLAEGTRFVRDDKITEFEDKSGELLARINGAGSDAGPQKAIDCSQLPELQANMTALVDLQTAKWTYMFGNIDAELAK